MTAGPGSLRSRWAAVLLMLATVAGTTLPVAAVAGQAAPATSSASAPVAGDARAPEPRITAADCPKPGKPDIDYLCPVGPTYLVPGLTDLAGWDEPSHYRNILTGDLDGDGADELVARGIGGTQVYRFDRALGQWGQVQIEPILRDADGWDQPQYYETVQLGDVDGDGKAELVARSVSGIIVFRYTPGTSAEVATWTQLTTSGPMPDFQGWGSDPKYYSTIQLVPLGRQGSAPTMQLIGRGGSGLALWRWSGSGWTSLATAPDFSDANGWGQPEYYSTIRVWDEGLLLARSQFGMVVYRYTSASGQVGSWQQLAQSGPCVDAVHVGSGPATAFGCDLDTIQLAHGVDGVPAGHPVLLARRSGPTYGLVMAHFDPAGGWTHSDQGGGNPWTGDFGGRPEYLRTIQAADIDGDGKDEVIGRSTTGMFAFRLAFDAQGRYRWGNAISASTPALAGDPWKDPQHYETIATAKLSPGSQARSLLARGAHGVRTWRFDVATSAWTRYGAYGSFPTLDATGLRDLTRYLGIARGSIRDVYTDPARDAAAGQLRAYQADIERTCSGPISASPPRFQSCSPPAGASTVSPAVWTAVSNQIIAELFWAGQVIDHFAALDDIQTALFLDEDSTFPSLTADLKLAQASGVVKPEGVDLPELFGGMLEIVGALEIPGVSQVAEITAGALGIAMAATPKASEEQEPSELDRTIAEVQRTLAETRQEIQDTIGDHRHQVLGDYGLMSTVGHLVSSQVWTLSKGAALSGGRQQFTRWTYEQFLPLLWDRWRVTGCIEGEWYSGECQPLLTASALLRLTPNSYEGTDIDGLLPRQTPCHQLGGSLELQCTFTGLEQQGYGEAVETLTGPVSEECTYDPAAGTSWRYGSCSLGVPAASILAGGPWWSRSYQCRFDTYSGLGTPSNGSRCRDIQATSLSAGKARAVGSSAARVDLWIDQPLARPLDLRGAKVRLHKVLHEQTGGKELVAHPSGRDVFPRAHFVSDEATRRRAAFRSSGAAFLTSGEISAAGGRLKIRLRIRGAALDMPVHCDGTATPSHLGMHLVIRDGTGRRVQVLMLAPWQCVRDRDGTSRLQYPPRHLSREVSPP